MSGGSGVARFGTGRRTVPVVCLSGRGDKDMDTAATWFGLYDEETT